MSNIGKGRDGERNRGGLLSFFSGISPKAKSIIYGVTGASAAVTLGGGVANANTATIDNSPRPDLVGTQVASQGEGLTLESADVKQSLIDITLDSSGTYEIGEYDGNTDIKRIPGIEIDNEKGKVFFSPSKAYEHFEKKYRKGSKNIILDIGALNNEFRGNKKAIAYFKLFLSSKFGINPGDNASWGVMDSSVHVALTSSLKNDSIFEEVTTILKSYGNSRILGPVRSGSKIEVSYITKNGTIAVFPITSFDINGKVLNPNANIVQNLGVDMSNFPTVFGLDRNQVISQIKRFIEDSEKIKEGSGKISDGGSSFNVYSAKSGKLVQGSSNYQSPTMLMFSQNNVGLSSNGDMTINGMNVEYGAELGYVFDVTNSKADSKVKATVWMLYNAIRSSEDGGGISFQVTKGSREESVALALGWKPDENNFVKIDLNRFKQFVQVMVPEVGQIEVAPEQYTAQISHKFSFGEKEALLNSLESYLRVYYAEALQVGEKKLAVVTANNFKLYQLLYGTYGYRGVKAGVSPEFNLGDNIDFLSKYFKQVGLKVGPEFGYTEYFSALGNQGMSEFSAGFATTLSVLVNDYNKVTFSYNKDTTGISRIELGYVSNGLGGELEEILSKMYPGIKLPSISFEASLSRTSGLGDANSINSLSFGPIISGSNRDSNRDSDREVLPPIFKDGGGIGKVTKADIAPDNRLNAYQAKIIADIKKVLLLDIDTDSDVRVDFDGNNAIIYIQHHLTDLTGAISALTVNGNVMDADEYTNKHFSIVGSELKIIDPLGLTGGAHRFGLPQTGGTTAIFDRLNVVKGSTHMNEPEKIRTIGGLNNTLANEMLKNGGSGINSTAEDSLFEGHIKPQTLYLMYFSTDATWSDRKLRDLFINGTYDYRVMNAVADGRYSGTIIDQLKNAELTQSEAIANIDNIDNTPPNITGMTITPSQTGASIVYTSNEAGKMRYLVISGAAANPTLAYLKDNGIEINMTSGGNSLSLSGLVANTSYKFCDVAKDGYGNWQTSVSCTDFQTNDLTDVQKVAQAKTNLSVGLGSNSDLNNVLTNLTFPLTQNGATVSWSSNTAGTVSNTGVVVRPDYGSGDSSVVLTATITVGSSSDTKVFNVNVKQYTALEAVTQVKSTLTVGLGSNADLNNVISNLTFPTAQNGTTITWSSNTPGTVSNTGVVVRPESGSGDSTVVLTATITAGGSSDTKVFNVNVKEKSLVAPTDAPTISGTATLHGGIYYNNVNDPEVTVGSVTGATGYEIQIQEGSNPAGAWGDLTLASGKFKLSDLGLSDGSYTIKVRAKNSEGAGPESTAITFTKIMTDATSATQNMGVVTAGGNVDKSKTGFSNYEVASIVSSLDGVDVTIDGSGNLKLTDANAGTDTGLITFATVKLKNKTTGVEKTVQIKLTVDAPEVVAPTDAPTISGTATLHGGIYYNNVNDPEVTVGSVTGATGYEIQIQEGSNPAGAWGDLTLASGKFKLSDLGLSDGSYTIKVRAKNNAGAGPESAAITFTKIMTDATSATQNMGVVTAGGNVDKSKTGFSDYEVASIVSSLAGVDVTIDGLGNLKLTDANAGTDTGLITFATVKLRNNTTGVEKTVTLRVTVDPV